MKKILLALLLLSACGENGVISENNFKTCESVHCNYQLICINGKQFIRGVNRMAIDLDFDGKPIPCKGSDEE